MKGDPVEGEGLVIFLFHSQQCIPFYTGELFLAGDPDAHSSDSNGAQWAGMDMLLNSYNQSSC